MRKRFVSTIIVSFLIVCSPLFASAQISTTTEPQINVLWILDDNGENAHAYRITFSDNSSYDVDIDIEHLRNGSEIPTYLLQEWKSIDSKRVLDVVVNTTLQWGDEVFISVQVNSVNGNMIVPVTGEREISLGTWNQPMDDHEVMLSTVWDLDQSYYNEEGDQGFFLEFEGQGWQKRTDSVLVANELGNGTLLLNESSDDGNVLFNLDLDSVWRNETTIDGVLSESEFEMSGNGTVSLYDNSD